jgi:hypothetical protein
MNGIYSYSVLDIGLLYTFKFLFSATCRVPIARSRRVFLLIYWVFGGLPRLQIASCLAHRLRSQSGCNG